MIKNKLTQEYLKECLHYDPETGIFTWNERPLSHFKSSHVCNWWNTKYANKEAGSIIGYDYLTIMINSKPTKAHRLAFLYMEGYLPEKEVDHKDRNKLNNKWDNLREVSKRCNMQNCNLSKNNTSGVTGVSWYKRSGKWRSGLRINYKYKHLGSFDDFDDAVMARYQEEVNNPEWTCSIDSSAFKYLQEKGEAK